eukprot:PhF_6_TR1035/c0_g2_i2/m.2107/K01922/PPCS, COAB; phosphopantothenate---cysteine ligase (ATP)
MSNLAEVEEFIANNTSHVEASTIAEIQQGITNFVQTIPPGKKIVLVTSGGTIVPLEKSGVRFITNFSSGGRGSALCEYFLQHQQDYYVLMLAKKGSLQPYDRHFQRLTIRANMFTHPGLAVGIDGIQWKNDPATAAQGVIFENAVLNQTAYGHKLHMVYYDSVAEYILYLKVCCQALQSCCSSRTMPASHVMVVLAAAVSDFYVPWNSMEEHKIQSRSHEGLTLQLKNVPKALGCVTQDWLPGSFVVGFKLESDPEILEQKAKSSIQAYKLHASVANLITNYNDRVLVYSDKEETPLVLSKRDKTEIEVDIVEALVQMHLQKN